MNATRLRIFAIWLLTTLLVALFVLAGGGKLAGTDQAVHEFQRFGYATWFMVLVGTIEVAAGLCLLFPRTALAGALGLVPIMGGAIWTLWRVGASILPPLIVGALLVTLAWLRWSTRPAHRAPAEVARAPGPVHLSKENE